MFVDGHRSDPLTSPHRRRRRTADPCPLSPHTHILTPARTPTRRIASTIRVTSRTALCVFYSFVLFQSVVPLGMFIGSTFLAITFMGGVYAVLPAYEADLFGEGRGFLGRQYSCCLFLVCSFTRCAGVCR